jgi:predicted acyltransferase
MSSSARLRVVSAQPSTTPAAGKAARLPAIDLLRGLAVIGMILVAYAGDWEHRFTSLTHADWRGFAIADMIFPSFLFCVGAALPFSFRHRAGDGQGALAANVVRRSLALVALGVFLNLLPAFDVGTVRLMGILQRIGLCYLVVGLYCVAVGRRTPEGMELPFAPMLAAAATIVIGYSALLLAWPAPDCGRACFDSVHSLPAVVDRALFGVRHMWPYGLTNGAVTYEPEGLVSTLGALVNVLAGVMASLALQRRREPKTYVALAVAGLACLAAGFLLDPVVPVVKKIWTPSFALLSSGFSLLLFLALLRTRAWTPVMVFGTNATLAFVGITLLDTLMQLPLLNGTRASLHDMAALVLGQLIPEARIASATYSVLLLALLGAGLWGLYRRRIFFKL